ncbi:hypothetical protein J1N35_021884 [Gossypium stocksii]|uniref:Uncharacterized protein n=1 Tax=Gossypium stocksii TaxID=47602 RepID=A0A9D3VFK6_9ROSI|nr:hypothetical protein J1N35_021884 [Gossypium stocksii]
MALTPMPTPATDQYVSYYSGVYSMSGCAHSPYVMQTYSGSLFYQCRLSSQPFIHRSEDTQWQSRMHGSQLTEGKEDELSRPQPPLEAKPRRNPTRNR